MRHRTTRDIGQEKTRVLLVDDEPETTRLMRLLLERRGYQVTEVNDSTKAIECAREFSPDVAIFDVMMPHLAGDELARRFGQDERLRTVPIIFVSAIVSVESFRARAALATPAFRMLAKPVSIEAVTAYIEQSL